jgi:uncharacterized protein YndB with AHSA1/START domain
MANIHIVRDYPHPPAKVWRAVTDPDLIPLWTATGQGGRPVGFAPVAGTKFQFVAKPVPGWRGIVDCEVLEVREPFLLRFSWTGEEGGKPTCVAYHIEPHNGGTRFTFDHTGFTGPGGFFMAKLLGSVRKKMLTFGLPAVLDDLDDTGTPAPPAPSRPTPRTDSPATAAPPETTSSPCKAGPPAFDSATVPGTAERAINRSGIEKRRSPSPT